MANPTPTVWTVRGGIALAPQHNAVVLHQSQGMSDERRDQMLFDAAEGVSHDLTVQLLGNKTARETATIADTADASLRSVRALQGLDVETGESAGIAVAVAAVSETESEARVV